MIGNILLVLISSVFLSILYIKSVDVINNTEKSLNLSLMSVWIIFCISISFLPSLNIIPLSVFISIVLYYCFLHKRVNIEEAMLMSSQITGSYTNLETNIYRKVVQLDGNIKSVPHIYAFIFSCLVSIFITYIPYPFNEYNIQITILSYLIILLLLTREIIRKKLSFSLWEQNLNSKRQILIDKNKQDDIVELKVDKTLSTIKTKLLTKEILLQTFVFGCCVIALKNYQLFDFQYPLSLAVLFSAFLFGEHILKFLKQISHSLIFSGRITNETFDFQEIKVKEEDKTLIQKINDFFNPFSKTRRFLNTLFIVIAILYTVVKIYNLLFN